MDHTVVHFEIPVDDPERATKFYSELFGWRIEKMSIEGGPEYWSVRTIPVDETGRPQGPGVNGGMMRRMASGQTPVNYVAVESVDEFVRKAQRLGGRVLMAKTPVPGMGWFAQLHDPEGNVIAVWETDSAAA